ncbi:hypothetical protein ACROYT_G014302 [Oculina patagonica]
MLSASSSNCSVQNKKIRNKKYYEDNKENLKNSKVRFQLNLEVKKEKGDWQNAIKTKIAFVKDQLHLSTKNTRAANAHLMEALLDNWLKNNHIPSKKNTSDEFVDQLHPSKADEEVQGQKEKQPCLDLLCRAAADKNYNRLLPVLLVFPSCFQRELLQTLSMVRETRSENTIDISMSSSLCLGEELMECTSG